MKYDFEVNEGFTGGYTVEEKDGITFLHIKVSSDTPARPKVSIHWDSPIVGSNIFWTPSFNHNKAMIPNWTVRHEACASISAPVIANVGYDDLNGITVAASDCENRVEIKSGVVHVNACFDNRVTFDVQKKVTEYEATVRVDERRLPFYEVIGDVGKWWRNDCGYREADVPEESFDIVYSTWYAFLQTLTADEVYEECLRFRDLGVKTVILDDGWQGPGKETPMDINGDWIVCPEKFPNMKKFVDSLHELGIKVMLWFPLSYLGAKTEAFKKYGKYGTNPPWSDSFVTIDPRYPEMRQYIVDTYTRVMRDYSLDGLKLDYIDAQTANREYKEGMDYESAFDALKKLLDDITSSVRAINPRAMIEFRQNYTGPVMHGYGTMIRVCDCPDCSHTNRVNSLDLRLLSDKVAIHSDMLLWHEDETAEGAAYQITSCLYCVPQISVRWAETSETHRQMMKFWLGFIDKNRDVLLHGDFRPKGLAFDYTSVSAARDGREIVTVYSGKTAEIRGGMNEAVVVNATANTELFIECSESAKYSYVVKNCMGETAATGDADFADGFVRLPCTQNGMVVFEKNK